MGLRYLVKPWTKVIWLALLMASVGCSQAVLLTHETEQGGVAAYLFKEDRGGAMGSPHRRDALKAVERKCPAGYTVINEGELQGYSSLSSADGQESEVRGRRWGIQFRCK